ncbi:Uu.00g073650.m01.CDS01 [Anthostomella pinea]|uniref:Uu.00g073650.m01.CDS01 n=1 Tax=Anthostomella pinea TaxID=933095 RepID=A0AAI8VVY0_9PEZI|nr:Uu.00g073650.m01.CDS01 [Anthostomella pinea]
MAASAKRKGSTQLLPNCKISEESFLREVDTICAEYHTAMENIVANTSPGDARFENVVRPMERIYNEELLLLYTVHFLRDHVFRSDLNSAIEKAQALLTAASGIRHGDERYMTLVESAIDKGEDLDPEDAKLLKYWGPNPWDQPPDWDEDRWQTIWERVYELGSKCTRNIDNDKDRGVWFTHEELSGMPDEFISTLARGEGEFQGRLRCPENISSFGEMITLRQKIAQLADRESFGAYMLESKMAGTPNRVLEFLDDIRDHARPRYKAYADKLLSAKEVDLQKRNVPSDGKIYRWDIEFCHALYRKRRWDVYEREVSEYFPVLPTISSILALVGGVFGFEFLEISTDEDRARLSPTGSAEDVVWDEDVLLYSVWDPEEDRFRGYLYLDLFSHSHPCYHNLQSTCELEGRHRHLLVGAINWCLTKPKDDKPALMTYTELIGVAHELGHALHDIALEYKYARYNAECSWDILELPSLLLEYWCWDPSVLKRLSSHYVTNRPMPNDMIHELVSRKPELILNGLMRRDLPFSYFDARVHGSADSLKGVSYAELFHQVERDLQRGSGVELPDITSDEDHPYTTYEHIMGLGYETNSYSYTWCMVFASDVFFSKFQQNVFDGKEGRRFRHMVLEKLVGLDDEMTILREYLGREPSAAAFHAEMGSVTVEELDASQDSAVAGKCSL